jgi:DNA (cytosine-5)-methyltransferase 1
MPVARPIFIDLFAGAGGFSLGAEWAGGNVTHAFEIDDWACKTLARNHPHSRVTQCDLRAVTEHWIRKNIPRYPDFIIGGPPCQGFSHAGPARKDPKDPRNSLFREFMKFVRIAEPGTAVIENVPGLLRAHTAAGRPVADVIRAEFSKLGYTTSIWLIEAHLHGVPQIRKRVFFVASQSLGELSPPTPDHCCDEGEPMLGLKKVLTVRDAISDLPRVEVGDDADTAPYSSAPQNPFQRIMRDGSGPVVRNHQPMNHTPRLIERFKQIRPGQSQSDVSAEHAPRIRTRRESKPACYDQNNRRMFWDRPCHTIAASFYANFLHPELHRNFTPREGARIQTFPDHYVFEGKATVVSAKLLTREGRHAERHLSQYNQIGNAVPPLLAQRIISHILQQSAGANRRGDSRPLRLRASA